MRGGKGKGRGSGTEIQVVQVQAIRANSQQCGVRCPDGEENGKENQGLVIGKREGTEDGRQQDKRLYQPFINIYRESSMYMQL
jgi:hypothetical protein